jgi:hypothetical protein
VSDIFDDLLAKVDYVPGLAVKFCCQDGKELTLAKILDLFPNVAPDGTASRTESHEQDANSFQTIFEDSQDYIKEIEEMKQIKSPLAIAILN